MLKAVIISDMSIIIFIIKHPHHSGRNVMLDLAVPDRIDGGARASVCGRSGGSARLVRFFSATDSVVGLLTWAGTGRVDISVQLLVGLIIIITL